MLAKILFQALRTLHVPRITRRRLQVVGVAFAMAVVVFALVFRHESEAAVQTIIGAFALLVAILTTGGA